MAAVVGLLTGAAGAGGFKGLAGRFARRDLLRFAQELPGDIRFRRLDTGQSVTATLQLAQVPADPRLPPLLQRLLAGDDEPATRELFASLWQERVRRILLISTIRDWWLWRKRQVSFRIPLRTMRRRHPARGGSHFAGCVPSATAPRPRRQLVFATGFCLT